MMLLLMMILLLLLLFHAGKTRLDGMDGWMDVQLDEAAL